MDRTTANELQCYPPDMVSRYFAFLGKGKYAWMLAVTLPPCQFILSSYSNLLIVWGRRSIHKDAAVLIDHETLWRCDILLVLYCTAEVVLIF